MPLTAGTRLGVYEILAPIGAGGMGEVYRARDTRLDRDVAIKILPESFAGDPDRLMRFEREARTLAALNHPNIAAIYGIEERALVMEFVDGEDLSRQIARGPLPVADALRIARQIAEALEAAHEQGIIHRDLKPANIKVREDGAVKVLDFGLAKALGPEGAAAAPDARHSPTMTSPALTAMGLILGTAAYMAPEQAKGRVADRRADVWAFGVVLHEMLTGRPLFAGQDVTDTLVAVLSHEPDLSALPETTPPVVRRLLARCLARDRRARLDSMGAVRLDIEEAMAGPAVPAVASTPRRPWLVSLALMLGGAIVGAAGVAWIWSAPAGVRTPSRIVSTIAPAHDALSAFTYGFALSPDGGTLVYTARGADGRRTLWKRRLADPHAERMPGTDGAMYPFWSPDSRHIGFFAGDQLKRIPADGGPPQTICEAVSRWGRGTWGADDQILFSLTLGWGRDGGRIYRVAAAGGKASAVPLDGDVWNPQWLPGGRHFLASRWIDTRTEVIAASTDGGEPVMILAYEHDGTVDGLEATYASGGFLIFNHGGVLSARAFDPRTLKTEGPITPLGDRVGTPRGWHALSAAGHMVVALNPLVGETGGTPGDPITRLLWVDRSGRTIGQLGEVGRYWSLRLSHDGQRALVNPDDSTWVIDARTNLRTLVATSTYGAIWMPGDREILWRQGGDLWVRPAGGEGAARVAFESKERAVYPWDVAPDGVTVVVSARLEAQTRMTGLWLASLRDGSLAPLVDADGQEQQASFSPDGQWIAYASDQTGRFEVYARPVAGRTPAVRLSAGGGQFPLWRGDGREIFFMSPTDEVVAVDTATLARTGTAGARTVLFRMVINDISGEALAPYAVSPDGQRFLMNTPAAPEPLTLMQLPPQEGSR